MTSRQALADVEWVRRRGFAEFVRRAWHQVDPAPLSWNWHLDAVCEHLEAVARREIRDLVINIPPGCSKSLLASVLWPAWMWALDPARRFIVASYAERVVLRDARKNRKLVDGDWYQARWPAVKIPRDRTASTAVSIFTTSVEGMRFSTTIPGGDVTGQHCHDALVDDPINPHSAEAASGVGLDAVLDWWRGVMPTRFLDHTTSTRTLIMQRVHERDLTSEFIRSGATILCLPMRYEPRHPHRYARDPRTEDGELLCPERIPSPEVDRVERTMGPTRVAAQNQQRPAPATGNIIKLDWLRYWTELPRGGTYALSIDCAFKDPQASSFVVIQVWYAAGANHYLVEEDRDRRAFLDTLKHILEVSARYPEALLKLIEDKANGSAIINVLKDKVPGLVAVNPGTDSKEARLRATEPAWAAGNVWLPHPTEARYPDGRVGAAWVPDHVVEITTFPGSAANDRVDAASQYLNHHLRNGTQLLEAAMANLESMFGGLG